MPENKKKKKVFGIERRGLTPEEKEITEAQTRMTTEPTFQVGGEQVTKEEFKGAKALAGFETGGVVTPRVREVLKEKAMPAVIEREKRAAGEEFLEEKGFYEEKLPEAVELEEERTGLTKLPVLGPGFQAGRGVLGREGNIFSDYYNRIFKGKIKPEKQQLLQNPETARELVLQEIQKKETKKGTSGSEKFGAFIESIPLIGPLAGKFAGGMLETPSANVDTVIQNIKESRGRVLKKYEATRANLIDPYVAYQSILDEEENMYLLEQRIKNLSIESAELIADADKLNVIEGKILRAKEVVYFAKQAAATAIKGEPTDPAIEAWLASERQALTAEVEE